MTQLCDPPSAWQLETYASRIQVTGVRFTNINPTWPYCSLIPERDVIDAATEEIQAKCAGNYDQGCSRCTSFLLAEVDKIRSYSGHSVVFVTRNGEIVDQQSADCQIDFDYSFDLVIKGRIDLCLPEESRNRARYLSPGMIELR